ncbi:hypothetical protein A3C89_01520 [Candidatus Kaiserbacteria bacterium RIFCSPHIGHO2_02_FULL_50_50]|uniref:DUF4190 domain-containing protein n=1 Tax=Candidatus Kaiserbacteria bacterium RIFCSPHIGHO2_02_FULL_50_50 TaxID=1798492 RepID=A0A1F6DCB7_9BACT|nr:MAG: hypothetical protein A3C89_01520 [Candidatus Kaiserbacteria bacterium RIFCSPHIGHO2_02_FULL_50_50]OGG89321.1 MAG: hypothetical protein A3G62_01595 [Candidatus Kaiserbacteria bacterium RIFCSPLOWO2_12_FULL_50_10]
MKKTIATLAGFTPAFALAATLPGTGLVKAGEGYAALFLNFVNGVLVPVLFAVIFLTFAWGVYQVWVKGANDADAKKKGGSLILNSVIGAVVILSFWGLVNFISGGLGLTDTGVQNVPKVPTINVN